MSKTYYDSEVVLNSGDVDEIGESNYPRKSQNTPDDLVFQLQEDLRQLGYLMASPDGAFGEGTERAVRKFQKDQQLDADGKVGSETKKALRRAIQNGETRDEHENYQDMKEQIVSLDYGFDENSNWINLVGVRGFWHGEVVSNTFNLYNDTIFALWIDEEERTHMESFDASCDPGRLAKPTEKGVAHLMEGQYFFSKGLHRGQYRALSQASPVRVKRYFDDDRERLKPYLDEGFFGINIHCGGISDEVNNWSAGCQIIKGGVKGPQWSRFEHLIYEVASPGQKRFRYSLLRGESLTA
jgi:hypothetical protein